MNFSESVEQFGLFAFTCAEMRPKRASFAYQQSRWLGPTVSRTKRTSTLPEPESLGRVVPIEEPRKPLVITTVDSVDERDEQLEAYLAPDPAELSPSEKGPVAGEDDIEDDEAQDNSGEKQEGENDMSNEIEKGAVSRDVVTDDAE